MNYPCYNPHCTITILLCQAWNTDAVPLWTLCISWRVVFRWSHVLCCQRIAWQIESNCRVYREMPGT